MKVLMLLGGRDFPPDIRVEKEARALTAGGHEVFVLCEWRSDRPQTETVGEVEVVRLREPPSVIAPVVKVYERLSHRSGRWKAEVERVLRDCAIEVLHVHDLPLVAVALKCARAAGIPLIADLHENFPAMVRIQIEPRASFRGKLLSWVQRCARWEDFERRWVGEADQVLVVVEEAKERLRAMGISEEKLTVIRNTVDTAWMEQTPLRADVLDAFEGDFVICYIGGLSGPHRGLETVIEAMPLTLSEIPDARLVLVGKGSMEGWLRRRAEELGIGSRVTLVGWQPIETIPSFIQRSEVCLVPHAAFEHTETTMPHKLFQYMAMGKPVVASSCRPLRRVVEETGSGIVFRAGDERSLADALITLRDGDLRTHLGEAGKTAARTKYNWKKDASRLLSVYESIAAD